MTLSEQEEEAQRLALRPIGDAIMKLGVQLYEQKVVNLGGFIIFTRDGVVMQGRTIEQEEYVHVLERLLEQARASKGDEGWAEGPEAAA